MVLNDCGSFLHGLVVDTEIKHLTIYVFVLMLHSTVKASVLHFMTNDFPLLHLLIITKKYLKSMISC